MKRRRIGGPQFEFLVFGIVKEADWSKIQTVQWESELEDLAEGHADTDIDTRERKT